MSLLIVQPILTAYRAPFFDGVADLYDGKVMVCADIPASDYGEAALHSCEFIEANYRTFLGLRILGLKKMIFLFKRSSRILHVADFKYISLWFFLILCFLSGKKIYLHGQGGYKRSGIFKNIIYKLAVYFCNGYICYTHWSASRLKEVIPKKLHRKISVLENTLYLNSVSSICNSKGDDILYIGRLRKGCGLELLLNAAAIAEVNVRIIGAGDDDYIEVLKTKYPNSVFYGGVYDQVTQMEIGKGCLAGAYGGDAGLSVVHYMALGLPVLIHDQLEKHMGPEPSYIENDVNGLYFKRGDVSSLSAVIASLKTDSDLRNRLACQALNGFKKLQSPSMHEKLITIMSKDICCSW